MLSHVVQCRDYTRHLLWIVLDPGWALVSHIWTLSSLPNRKMDWQHKGGHSQMCSCSSLEHHYGHDVSFGKETHRANNTRHNHFWSLNCPSFTPPYPPTTIFSNILKDVLQKGIQPICGIKARAGINVCSWLHQNAHKQSDGEKEESWRGEGCSQTTSRVSGNSSSRGGVARCQWEATPGAPIATDIS